MRGIYSMAALMALEECSLGKAFDHVIGSSSGAVNGAYLVAEQAKMAVTVYLEDISNSKFINYFRIRKIVDIDYLVDDVLKRRKVLNVERISQSKSILHIVLTDYLTGESVMVTSKDSEVDLMEAIRATAAMPILYNKVIKVKNGGYIDGAVTDPVPLMRAIELGCTDILLVLTRPLHFRRAPNSTLLAFIEKQFMKEYPNRTREIIVSEDHSLNRTMDFIQRFSGDNHLRISVVCPSDMKKMVSRTTGNQTKLLECALMARNDMRVFLGLDSRNDNPFC